jgi:diadenylate cyclase
MDLSLQTLSQYLQPLSTWADLLDILLVTLVFYNLLLLIRGTRAVQMLFGILVLVGFYYTAQHLGLPALETTLENFFLFLPVAIIVLFQHEIRRALANFGRTSLLGGFGSAKKVAPTFDEIVAAAAALAQQKVGALIVLERSQGLRNYVENGILIDGIVSIDLLISLFTPDTPTHDGAVIIHRGRIAAATCFLPLTRNSLLSKEYGTRHRAALGISEEADALAIVVSEETGQISVALDGEMSNNLSPAKLRNLLYRHLLPEPLQEAG